MRIYAQQQFYYNYLTKVGDPEILYNIEYVSKYYMCLWSCPLLWPIASLVQYTCYQQTGTWKLAGLGPGHSGAIEDTNRSLIYIWIRNSRGNLTECPRFHTPNPVRAKGRCLLNAENRSHVTLAPYLTLELL